jgi:hypothetical protein
MTFLRNEDGEPFAIIESLNGYALVNDEKPERRKPEDMRLVCDGVNAEDDAFAFRGYVAYANELFGARRRQQQHDGARFEQLIDPGKWNILHHFVVFSRQFASPAEGRQENSRPRETGRVGPKN